MASNGYRSTARPTPFAELLARATVATLEDAAAKLRARLRSTQPAVRTDATLRLPLIEAELDRRAEAARQLLAAPHDYRREDRDDAVRMVCKCGKRSRWGTYAQLSAAAERHADETARRAR